ncbi:DinB family protein [Fictibacillus terranigra]|uniref:DinB family protein n=1 Tax=Fictibacillus terranigra TaxID=3058424 RepID=A0ABT8E8R7_9BACL|nr:DinB family protein [Fictibacillus sp. CENA-BCM004]MDN4074307.1 DinB family protein [Fictibacillus sp. CENA-BCM004]
MNQHLYKQFEMTRGLFLRNVSNVPAEIVDIQPEGFNNTIHWHIGHVLTVTEQFLFGFPKKSAYLPEDYVEWFGNGTKPADWKGAVPSVEELVNQLQEQLVRIKDIPEEALDEKLKKPFLGLETFRELANFAVFHETNHLGQLHTIKLLVERTVVKN